MECSRCGGEAVVKRDSAIYCGKCAMACDWEEIIHVVQTDKLHIDKKPKGSKPKSRSAETSTTPKDSSRADEAPAPADPFA